MQRGIAGMALLQHDLLTGIEAADAAGYEILELWADTVTDFLDAGRTVDEVAAKFETVSIRPISIVAIDDIDLPEGPERQQMIRFCRRMCEVAQALDCRNIQMVSGVLYEGLPWPTIRRETARGLREMADIAAEYGLRVSYEPLAWRTVWSVKQGLEVIEEADRPNVGLLVDAFHAFAGGDDVEAIRKLDPEIITTFHLGDAGPRQGDQWSDDDRTVMLGEGIVPAREITEAVLDTGYDGLISDEVFPTLFSDWSAERIARTLKAGADAILASLLAT